MFTSTCLRQPDFFSSKHTTCFIQPQLLTATLEVEQENYSKITHKAAILQALMCAVCALSTATELNIHIFITANKTDQCSLQHKHSDIHRLH